MHSRHSLLWSWFGLGLAVLTGGCGHKPVPPSLETPVIAVSRPVVREVTEYMDFTGRTDAVESVDVKARVTGYLVQIGFQAGTVVRGDEVVSPSSTAAMIGLAQSPLAAAALLMTTNRFPDRRAGSLLFQIDPRPYQASLDALTAQIKLQQARLELAVADLARAKEVAKTPGAISQQELDHYIAAQSEAAAAVEAARANCETARLNLEFTRITAPISGKISRNFLTVGNLVTQDQTLLTTIVSEDPIYAYFDVDELTMLRVQELVRQGKIRPRERGKFPVFLGLANEDGFPHEGTVDFLNNVVTPSTGTLTVRGVFANPRSVYGPRSFVPGEFVRVRLPLGAPSQAILVAERALGTDQGQKYLLLVDEENKVQYRRVRVGPLQEDSLRVVIEGLSVGDKVVVSGLQQVQPRQEVQTDLIEMPVQPVPGGKTGSARAAKGE
jgi:multidrug efflux system membrane fusion protein